jgi:RNA polymerase sigma factor (sigma-70 family)
VSPDEREFRSIAEALAAASLGSLRAGNLSLAHTRLSECLGILQGDPDLGAGAAAFQAAAELASTAGEPEAAVEFYGACERMLRRSRTGADGSAEDRLRALDHLRRQLGEDRFGARWSAAGATPLPFEFYVSKAIDWLRDLEPRLRAWETAPSPPTPAEGSAGTTARLIRHVHDGHSSALSRLAVRVWEPLRRFTHGRLPPRARDLLDTDDIVQSAVVRGLNKAETLHPVRKGRFLAYLRKIVVNRVRDEIRRVSRRPATEGLSEALASRDATPLETLLLREGIRSYRAALDGLPRKSRDAVVLRIEDGCSYQEVADAVGCPSANAARMLVARALRQVADSMRKSGRPSS